MKAPWVRQMRMACSSGPPVAKASRSPSREKATALTGSVTLRGQLELLLPGVGLPDARRLVGAARREEFAVRGEGEAGDPIGVAFEFDVRSGRKIDADDGVGAAGGEVFAVGRPGHREHLVLRLLYGGDRAGLEIERYDLAGTSRNSSGDGDGPGVFPEGEGAHLAGAVCRPCGAACRWRDPRGGVLCSRPRRAPCHPGRRRAR